MQVEPRPRDIVIHEAGHATRGQAQRACQRGKQIRKLRAIAAPGAQCIDQIDAARMFIVGQLALHRAQQCLHQRLIAVTGSSASADTLSDGNDVGMAYRQRQCRGPLVILVTGLNALA
ncbi:MAG: hypothetical protein HC809_03415, partial [Gammaproteobacteria bacterium]|nr:hypothetical protein [Gammaproteobacteria bacterium]